ncbi:MAG: hypothetical protein ACT4QC_18235 [Planctomycetaceae bacterium]
MKMPERDPSAVMRANVATMIALFGLLLVGGALLGLMALVLPQFLGILLVVGIVFVGPIAFHYLVWGWWLSAVNKESLETDDPDTE